MTVSLKAISADHLQQAMDAILGIDASQAPTDPVELNERLSIPQKGITEALGLVAANAQTKQSRRAMPLVYVAIESANIAYPDEMKDEIKAKAFVTALAGSAGEAQAAARDRVRWKGSPVSASLSSSPSSTSSSARRAASRRKLSFDDRAGAYALVLGAIRAVDKHLLGPDRPVQVTHTPGRNEPCSCGSGKKYKKGHGANA